MDREIPQSVQTNIMISGSAVASVRYGHTGREVLGAEAKCRADEWASLTDRDDLLRNEVATDFRELLPSVSLLAGESIVLYRGQGIRDGDPIPTSIERMGPLPLDRTPGEGRYHQNGQRVLYLAESQDGVQREMEAWYTQGVPYVIEVKIPLASLLIADFTDLPYDHLITAVFSNAEMCKIDGRGPDNYLFSQTVGNIVSERFHGMRIPGVRGAMGAHYNNVVLFQQLKDWPKWTDPAKPPFCLRSPTVSAPLHDHIQAAAYYLWEKDGRVHGRDKTHWFGAIEELRRIGVSAICCSKLH